MEYLKKITFITDVKNEKINNLELYLHNMKKNEYYILNIIDDLINLYEFKIIYDYLENDVRTIKLINLFEDVILINSYVTSKYGQNYTEYNKLFFKSKFENNNIDLKIDFFGKKYKM